MYKELIKYKQRQQVLLKTEDLDSFKPKELRIWQDVYELPLGDMIVLLSTLNRMPKIFQSNRTKHLTSMITKCLNEITFKKYIQ